MGWARPMPNAYVVGVEEAANNDFQDLVYIIRNVSIGSPERPARNEVSSTTTAASSQMAPAFTRSSLMPGEPVTRTPR